MRAPRTSSTQRILALFLVTGLGFVAGCLPEFDLTDKDRCKADEDCSEGRFCDLSGTLEGGLGRCIDSDATLDPQPDDSLCRQNDEDRDGASSLEGCEAVDCDDADDRRSPLLPEFCDGVDNDCDDIIDEAALNVCGRCGPQPAEVCNDRDDDCDGTSDEGVTNACGTCGPAPTEFCDLEDNDCDGLVDEGIEDQCACQDGESRVCPTNNDDSVVVCTQGQQTCTQGRWGPCEGSLIARPEVCDGKDNDCDNGIDEGFDLDVDTSHCGACGRRCVAFQAVSNCVEGVCRFDCRVGFINQDGRTDNGCETPCPDKAEVETCDDGLDNDCNGLFDDGCPRSAIAGEYAFFNLFGRSAQGLPPGLVIGKATMSDPSGPTATFTDLTLFAAELEGGQFAYSAEADRQLDLDGRGSAELVPTPEGDVLGGRFRGVMSPARHIAALIEFNEADQQVASFALLFRRTSPSAPASNLVLRGLYTLALSLPGQLLSTPPQADAAPVFGLSFKPIFPTGEGRHEFLLGARGLTVIEDPFEYRVGRDSGVQMAPLGGSPLAVFSGLIDDRGSLGILTSNRVLGDGDTVPRPGLALLVDRRDETPPMPAAGEWTLVGLQTAILSDTDQLSYNAVLTRMGFEATDDPKTHRVIAFEEGEEARDVGTIALEGRGREASLALDVRVSDNLQPPRLLLRGHLDDRREVIVWWEVDEEDPSRTQTSLFLAIKSP